MPEVKQIARRVFDGPYAYIVCTPGTVYVRYEFSKKKTTKKQLNKQLVYISPLHHRAYLWWSSETSSNSDGQLKPHPTIIISAISLVS